MTTIGERLRTLRDAIGESQKGMASRFGLSENAWQRLELESRAPKGDVLAQLIDLGFSVDWLLTGRGQMQSVSEGEGSPVVSGFVAAPAPTSVPVLGLAECGIAGWYRDGSMAVRATRPGDLRDPDAFAVIAIGTSMIPAGISPGYLCFCSPADQPDIGDAVYIERDDGTASIKLFGGVKEGWLILQGWLTAEAGQAQMAYVDKIKTGAVRKIATVIYVKRKL